MSSSGPRSWVGGRVRRVVLAGTVAAIATGVVIGGVTSGASSTKQSVRPSTAGITSEPYGTLDNGKVVTQYTLTNANGMVVKLLDWGGIITDIEVPDRAGNFADVTLGLNSLDQYRAATTYFGAIIGRYANRIANHQFTLDGTTYVLSRNNGPNTLHGGKRGWDKRLWTATEVTGPDSVGIRLERTSPNGEMGFPGRVDATVTISLTDDNKIDFVYHATTNAPTVINMTNHSYFNLAGEGSGDVFNTLLYLNADGYTPVNENLIPTGAITPVAGTAFDFTTPTPIGTNIHDGDPQIVIAHGFDHNWVLNRPAGDTSLILAATAEDPTSGRVLSVWTTEPGIQFYSGNFLDGSLVGPSGHTYRQSDGFTLETQHYPDSPNEPSFPSTVLRPGESYDSHTIYAFSVDG
jgi:aldose 1-epimerase